MKHNPTRSRLTATAVMLWLVLMLAMENARTDVDAFVVPQYHKVSGIKPTTFRPKSSSPRPLPIPRQDHHASTSSTRLEAIPWWFSFGVSSWVTYTVMTNVVFPKSELDDVTEPYPNQRYDADTSRAFFDKRVNKALARGAFISTQSLAFVLRILQDQLNNRMEEMSEQRGRELAELLTTLGPSFIKIGQSLSIRTDLLSPAYVRGLQSLQDQVPAFDTEIAKTILQQEWKVDSIYDVLQDISPEPVAAASLGQVYKATLKGTGQSVAIKVQRPDIMEMIALDMYVLREWAAPLFKAVFNLNTDTVGTVDAWGAGFIDELDYLQEAQNGNYFMERIQETPLKDVVVAPTVIDDFTTTRVLMTEWIDGERLDKSSASDVTVLCSIAMNTYLTMMLELGLLHCDPHPGNLLRTKADGKLCILDWGMVTRVEPDRQLILIEHMAHLTSGDYEEVPRDLLLLGFIPESKAHLIEDSGVVEVLADVYGQWTQGGGANAINVNDVIAALQDLQATRGNLFRIPPYFAYIAKSFSVLEGIGLSNDPKYSIINECLPYVSKRLLSDKETMGPALSTFVFGPSKDNVPTRIVQYKRIEQLVTGFGNYTTSASGMLLGNEQMQNNPTQWLDETADLVLDLILTEESTPFQDILLEQMAKIITASSRSVWAELRQRSGTLPSGRTVLGTLMDPFGIWRSSPLVQMNELDEEVVETTRRILGLLQTQFGTDSPSTAAPTANLSQAQVLELSRLLLRKVWGRRRAISQTGNRLALKVLQLTADRLEAGDRVNRRAESTMTTSAAALSATTDSSTTAPRNYNGMPPPLAASATTTSTTNAPSNTKATRIDTARQLLTSAQQQVVQQPQDSASERLQDARRRLEQVNEDEASRAVVDVITVQNKN